MSPESLPCEILGQGFPVVLLHAFPLTGAMWRLQEQPLSERFHLIIPDQRGFGAASRVPTSLDEIPINLAADDLASTLEDCRIPRAFVVGISRGGYVALAFAARHKSSVAGLILMDTRATPADPAERDFYQNFEQRLRTDKDMAFAVDAMRSRLLGKTTLESRPEIVREVEAIIKAQSPEPVAAAARGMVNRPDLRPILATIDVPVLAIAGLEDKAFASTRDIANSIKGARFVEVPESGHLSNMDRPDIVNAEILAFLGQLPSE